MEQINLKEEIRRMEASERKPASSKDTKVTFDSWYLQRKEKIPSCHLKEIILADFKARGIPSTATMSEYDKALQKYGVKLSQ